MNKEYNNSFSLAIAKTKGYDRNKSLLAQKEFDRRAKLASNYRNYCRNMQNREEKLQYLDYFIKNLGTENIIMVTASSHIPISENRAVNLMSMFEEIGNYVAVTEKAERYHLHYIVNDISFANHIVKHLKRLKEFKSKPSVHLLNGDDAIGLINYILKAKYINSTHIRHYF